MSSIVVGPLLTQVVDATQPIAIVASMPVDSLTWGPVAALGSEDQERLSSELVGVLHGWMKRIRPGLWRNLRGELYPQDMDHLADTGAR